MRFLDDFKYDWPLLYRISQIILTAIVFLFVLLVIPKGDATQAMGITNLQDRLFFAGDSIYWKYKSLLVDSHQIPKTVKSGYISGLDNDGKLSLSVTTESKFSVEKIELADIKITDIRGASNFVSEKSRMRSKVEMYEDEAVVWIGGQSLNVDLVMAGVAEPRDSQKTDIISSVLSAYFWRRAIGN